ncbi:hypothetical protein N7471_009140 [Penicillium samsonianum]|uniref:uncharacterized protein n=1 Tax=Penicillium samsonianum TaxID=1882272 RepID=UPI0025487029|nr:uncharacterized protein N7471_009140 [Penicillium samsonianum]KAJ6127923.1 hypothetical protein N7471_009140 [Penicillium samsonianum]
MLFRAAGDSLTTVANTKLGIIRMLNCWQHLQPLVKYNTYAQDEESIFAAWPYGDGLGDERWSVYNEANEMTAWTASSMYALEGGFVLVTNQPISAEEMKESTECHAATGQSFAWNEEGGVPLALSALMDES